MRIFFVDTETTGLSPKPGANELVQLGAYITEGRTILEAISVKSRPENWGKISQQALDVTHLTKEMLKGYPPAKESFEKVYATALKHKGSEKLVLGGQNVKFDEKFVRLWWNTWKDTDQKSFEDVFDCTRTYDLMEMTKILKDMGILIVDNVKLGTIATALALTPNGELHDAMTDIDLTYRAMFDLIDRINYLNNELLSQKFEKFMCLR